MADNSLRTPGSGETIATDDVGGVKYPRSKLVIGADGTAVDVQPPDADGKAAASVLAVGGMMFNGATLDRERGNIQGTLLASAARTASTTSPAQTNYNARGVILMLNVTAAGTSYVQIAVVATDPVSSSGIAIATAAQFTTTGQKMLVCYPGVTDADFEGVTDGRSVAIPRTWDGRVIKGDASSWTFSLGYSLLV